MKEYFQGDEFKDISKNGKDRKWKERKIKTWYYTTNLHKGAFMLPKYVEDMLEEEEKQQL